MITLPNAPSKDTKPVTLQLYVRERVEYAKTTKYNLEEIQNWIGINWFIDTEEGTIFLNCHKHGNDFNSQEAPIGCYVVKFRDRVELYDSSEIRNLKRRAIK